MVLVQVGLSALKLEFYMTQLTMSAYYTLVALGLCLLMGYAGPGLHGARRLLCNRRIFRGGARGGRDLPHGLSLPAAILITGLVALVIGIPVLRLRGHYLAMATLAFGIIVLRVLLGTNLFGGADGLSDIPAFHLFAGLAITGRKALRVQNYYIAWGLVCVGCSWSRSTSCTPAWARALRAIHGNEDAAAAMGVDVARFKLATFVLSAVYAGVGGACLAYLQRRHRSRERRA